MATKKSASKTTSRASINIPFLSNKKQNKKTEKQVEKTIKKASGKTLIIGLLCLIFGALIGIGDFFLVSKNDTFEIIGPDEITLTLSDTYKDEGVKIIEFGKDISSSAVTTTNMEKDASGNYFSNEVGTFFIKYTVDSFKYGKIFKIQKIKLVTFVEASEGGE